MREYGKVSPQFWIGKTGKALRGNPNAQLLALYLMTSPHANMIGVYPCPIVYMAHETGMTIEGASEALRCLIEVDFCTFDADDEYVFVHEFAAHQVGESLDPKDKRCKGVENELFKVPKNQCWQAFTARYAVSYNLQIPAEKASHSEAPSKPLASQEQKQEQKQNIDLPRVRVAAPDGVGDETWKAFLAVRKAKKAPMSELALVGIKREAEKAGWSLEAALSESVTRGWSAFKADWVAGKGETPERSSALVGAI